MKALEAEDPQLLTAFVLLLALEIFMTASGTDIYFLHWKNAALIFYFIAPLF